jgi:hypothetical protein
MVAIASRGRRIALRCRDDPRQRQAAKQEINEHASKPTTPPETDTIGWGSRSTACIQTRPTQDRAAASATMSTTATSPASAVVPSPAPDLAGQGDRPFRPGFPAEQVPHRGHLRPFRHLLPPRRRADRPPRFPARTHPKPPRYSLRCCLRPRAVGRSSKMAKPSSRSRRR